MVAAKKPPKKSIMGKPPKTLSRQESRTALGRFAAHLAALMAARSLTSHDLADRLKLGEPAVRRWLRGDGWPDYLILPALGKALGLDDYRHVLPPE